MAQSRAHINARSQEEPYATWCPDLGYRAGFCPLDLSIDDISYLTELRSAFEEQDVVIGSSR